jgi:hypothetical protein
LRRVFATILLTLLGSIATPASHRWANANEYNLAMQAMQERDVIQQFALLNDWQTRYPNSDFANLRTFATAKNLERQGKLEDSFTRAAELLQSQPPDSAALWLIVEIGPKLTPSGKVATAVQDAALKLKSMENERRLQSGRDDSSVKFERSPSNEDRRMDSYISEIRVPNQIRQQRNAAAVDHTLDAALEWAERYKQSH